MDAYFIVTLLSSIIVYQVASRFIRGRKVMAVWFIGTLFLASLLARIFGL